MSSPGIHRYALGIPDISILSSADSHLPSTLSPTPSDFYSPTSSQTFLNGYHGNASGGAIEKVQPAYQTYTAKSALATPSTPLATSPLLLPSPSLAPLVERQPHSEKQRPRLFCKEFFQRDDEDIAAARRDYLRSFLGGVVLIICTIFTVFSIYWGALWKIPIRPLSGLVVDFDGGIVGLNITLAILATTASPNIKWSYAPSADYPLGPLSLADGMREEKAWVAISVNPSSSEALNSALLNPIAGYNGALSITVYTNEARSETAFRNYIRPQTMTILDTITSDFARSLARQISISPSIGEILSLSPQTITQPISYTFDNVLPFPQPVASAATSAGLIYLLITSFFLVMTGHRARDKSGLNKQLRLESLIWLRFISSFTAYFVISLFYSSLNKAFRLDFSPGYGRSGFMVFWMLSWVGMLSVGLALESLITVFTPRYMPFILIFWIIVNVSVCINPIETMPSVYRYGFITPLYNISRSVRTITMGTKNEVGLNFGVLVVWVILSSISLLIIQWYARRRDLTKEELEKEGEVGSPGHRQSYASVSQYSTSKLPMGLGVRDLGKRGPFSLALGSPIWRG